MPDSVHPKLAEVSIPRLLLLFITLLLFSATPGWAQLSVTGFVRNYNAIQIPSDNDIIIGRNRIRLDLTRNLSNGRIFISNDIQNLYSAASDSVLYRPREAYLELYFDTFDLRVGRQIISWGRADGTFITDILTPVDLREFLTQDFNDLRVGLTAANLTRYFGSNFAQLVVSPVFNPNQIPSGSSRWFPNSIFPGAFPVDYQPSDNTPQLGEVQAALRYAFRENLSFNIDLFAYWWHYPNPTYRKQLENVNVGGIQLPVNFVFREQYLQSLAFAYSGFVKLNDRLILTPV